MEENQITESRGKNILKNITLDTLISSIGGFTLGSIFGSIDACNNSVNFAEPTVAAVAVPCGGAIMMRYGAVHKNLLEAGKGVGRVVVYGLIGMQAYKIGYTTTQIVSNILKH